MRVYLIGPNGRRHGLVGEPLRSRHDPTTDIFQAVAGGHEALATDPCADALYVGALRFLLAGADAEVVGFQVVDFSRFDPELGNLDPLYTPRFDVPQLGLVDATVGDIITTAQEAL